MAASIVTTILELDDRSFQNGITNATDSVSKFSAQFEAQISAASRQFVNFGNILKGLVLGKVVTDTANLAKQLTSLSNATGISIQNIKGFQDAISAAGGDSIQASDAISDLVKNVGEAANSGGDLLNAFNQVGIGLAELQSLSEADILRKTIEGLAKIPDSATRSSIGMKLMGEAVKTVDFTNVNKSIAEFTANASGIDTSARAAAAAQKNLGAAYTEFQVQLLAALKPVSEFAVLITSNKETIKNFAESLVNVGVALGGLFVISKILTPLATLAEVATLSGQSLWKTAAGATGFSSAIKSAYDGIRLLGASLGGFLTIGNMTGGLFSNIKLLSTALGGGLVRLIPIVGWVYTAFEGLNFLLKTFTGDSLFGWVDEGIAKLSKLLGITYETSKAKDEAAAKAAENARLNREEIDKEIEAERQLQEEKKRKSEFLDKEVRGLQDALNAYRRSNEEQIKKINLDKALIGLSEEQKQRKQELADMEKRKADEIIALEKKISETKDATLKAEYQAAIKRINEAYNEQVSSLESAITSQQKKNRENQLSIFTTEQLISNQERLKDLQDQIAAVNMTPLQKQYQAIEIAARKAADAKIAEEEKRRGKPLDDIERLAFYKATAQETIGLIGLTNQLNEAETARRLNLKFDEEKVNYAKELKKVQNETAKLTMTELERKERDIRDAAEERLAALIRAEEVSRGYALNEAERKKLTDQSTAATQDLINATRENYDQSRSWSTGWQQAFNDYAENATNAASVAKNIFGKAMKGMEDLLVNFVKTGEFNWKNFVNMMLEELLRAQIQSVFAKMFSGMNGAMSGTSTGGSGALLGNALSSLGGLATSAWDSFAGLFADGGNIPAGKWGIAGEAGPEIINGPATVTPVGNVPSGNTIVNYNISAVDAMSFKQMIARDPSFIHAVASQGAKSAPVRR